MVFGAVKPRPTQENLLESRVDRASRSNAGAENWTSCAGADRQGDGVDCEYEVDIKQQDRYLYGI